MQSKYQVITYSPDDGADERPEHATIKAATAAARQYIAAGYATAAIIYNTAAGRIVRTFGDFPQNARPTEPAAMTGDHLQKAINAAASEYYRHAGRPCTDPTAADLAPLDRAAKRLETLQAEQCRRLGLTY